MNAEVKLYLMIKIIDYILKTKSPSFEEFQKQVKIENQRDLKTLWRVQVRNMNKTLKDIEAI